MKNVTLLGTSEIEFKVPRLTYSRQDTAIKNFRDQLTLSSKILLKELIDSGVVIEEGKTVHEMVHMLTTDYADVLFNLCDENYEWAMESSNEDMYYSYRGSL